MDEIKVFLEVGKRKTFAGAVGWPGWCRWAKDEAQALHALLDYGPRYAVVLEDSGLDFFAPSHVTDFTILEQLEGNRTTDFGAPDSQLVSDREPFQPADIERAQMILQACWRTFDRTVQAALGKEFKKGPRGGGRDLEKMVNHVLDGDQAYLRRLAWKYKRDQDAPRQAELDRVRGAILQALEAAADGKLPNKGPRGGKVWPVRFFIRRVAWHTLDHTWEIEDRVLE